MKYSEPATDGNEPGMEYSITLKCLGETRPGVNGYGILIHYRGKQLDFLAAEVLFSKAEQPEI